MIGSYRKLIDGGQNKRREEARKNTHSDDNQEHFVSKDSKANSGSPWWLLPPTTADHPPMKAWMQGTKSTRDTSKASHENGKAKKKNGSIDQMTLFEPQTKYNTKASKTENFSFYSDERYINEAKKAYDKFREKKENGVEQSIKRQ